MNDPVVVATTEAWAGAARAHELIGGVFYPGVKLIDGAAGSSEGVVATSGTNPAAGAVGLVVIVKNPGAAVATTVITVQTILGTVVVTGTVAAGAGTTVVSVTGSAQVSGTVTVNTAATVAGASITIQNGASVSAQVSGTVTVAGSVTIQQGASVVAQVSGTITQALGTAIAFRYSTAVAGTVLTVPLVTVAMNLTTVATSAYVVPAGKVLLLDGINGYVANTLAAVGYGRGAFQVVASSSYSATVGPVYAALNIANQVSITGVRAAGVAVLGAVPFPAGATVQFDVHITGASSQPCDFVVNGRLVP